MNIRTEGLNKKYCRSAFSCIVLRNINLDIPSAQKVALIGPSGAGKSTLIHILGLMDRPSSGKVYINEVDCFTENDKYLRGIRKRNIGFIFQFHYLMPEFTVFENILIPVWKERNLKLKRAVKLLKQSGLFQRRNHYPSELSGGEQQRTAVVRALINKPGVIFADEPTGNLDRCTGIEIENLLFDCASDIDATLVIVTHDTNLAEKTDRIIKIADGCILNS
ncbi:MAG: ABC transporter ATP-binding protein [Endomicrobium sp.]|jgi:ABC-type lipoprotein export system ATPase subunit|nr:ABC transporter ATP-binding protein [Endomicrobium sp.]